MKRFEEFELLPEAHLLIAQEKLEVNEKTFRKFLIFFDAVPAMPMGKPSGPGGKYKPYFAPGTGTEIAFAITYSSEFLAV